MKKLLFIVFFVFIAVPLFAQTGWGAHIGRLNRSAIRNNRFNLKANVDAVEGTPFYYKKWKKGTVIKKTGEVSSRYYLLYVLLTNELLLQENGEVYVVDPEVMKGFTLEKDGKKTLFKKGFPSKKYDIKPSKYLRIIYDRKLKLVANYKIDKRVDTELLTNKKTLHLEKEKWYYIITSDGTFHEVELEKDDILNVLPGDNAKLKELTDKFNLDYSNTKQLQKILSIHEQLNTEKEKG